MSLCIDDRLVCRFWWDAVSSKPAHHLYGVPYTRCPVYAINSRDDGHMAARNMWRTEININEKELYVKLVIYKDSLRSIFYSKVSLRVW